VHVAAKYMMFAATNANNRKKNRLSEIASRPAIKGRNAARAESSPAKNSGRHRQLRATRMRDCCTPSAPAHSAKNVNPQIAAPVAALSRTARTPAAAINAIKGCRIATQTRNMYSAFADNAACESMPGAGGRNFGTKIRQSVVALVTTQQHAEMRTKLRSAPITLPLNQADHAVFRTCRDRRFRHPDDDEV